MSGRWQRTTAVLERSIGADTILVPVSPDGVADLTAFFRLEGPVARWIWERLSEPSTAEQLAAGLEDEFEVESGPAKGDALDFLRELAEQGLVREV